MLMPVEDLLYSVQTSPELRRADLYNRARREEMEAMLYGMNPRHNVNVDSSTRLTPQTHTIAEMFHGLRRGIGNALITAGNRIQNPA